MPAKALVGGTSLAGPTVGERWALCDTWMSYMEEFELSDDYLYAIEITKVGGVYNKSAGELWRSYHAVL